MWGFLTAAWQWTAGFVDLSCSELLTIVVSVSFPVVRMIRYRKRPHEARIELLIADLLRGAAFSTFLLLLVMASSKQFMLSAFEENRVVLFFAGLIGAASVLKADKWVSEHFRDPSAENKPKSE
jgi:hypothetical protein